MNGDFSHLAVEFFMSAKHNKRKSAEAGRPVYDDVEMVKIRIAGDPKSVLVAPANDQSSARDPQTNARLTYAQLHEGPYEAFKKGIEYRGSGTPLTDVTFLTAAQRKTLEGANVFTVEALAQLDGANLQKLGMGAREWKNQATAWLDKASGSADITKLAAENASLQQQIEALKAKIGMATSPTSAPEPEPDESSASSPFAEWQDEDIKNFIKDRSGEKPRSNASHATLVRMADEILANEKAAEAA